MSPDLPELASEFDGMVQTVKGKEINTQSDPKVIRDLSFLVAYRCKALSP